MNFLKYGQIEITSEVVTPAVAERWLEQNDCNRRIRNSAVSQYARDMERGEWHMKPIAICFDENNKLGNGQHTLMAIIKSRREQHLLIARNVPRESIAAMDQGVRRTVSDIAHFLNNEFDTRRSALARMIAFGPLDNSARSFSELFLIYQEHAEAIDFVIENSPGHAVGFSAAVLSPCARAWYSQNREKIKRFLEIMKSGIIENESEIAAIRLRDFCRNLKSASSTKTKEEIYRKTESALINFFNGIPISKLYGFAEEQFPIMSAS